MIALVAVFVIGGAGSLLGDRDDKSTDSSVQDVSTAGSAAPQGVPAGKPVEQPSEAPVETFPEGAGYVGKHYVETKDAIMTTDYEGNPVIVVTFSWTNNGDEACSSMSEVMAKVFQNGVELETAVGVMNKDVFDSKPYMLEIKPGTSIDVQRAFLVRDVDSPVEFEMGRLFGDGDVVSKTFVPSELEMLGNDRHVSRQASGVDDDTSVQTAQDSSQNPLMALDVKTRDVMNGSKMNVIGEQAWVDAASVDMSEITEDMFREFVDARINGASYNWFTIVLGDGNGIVATGCNTVILDYGKLSSNYGISDVEKYIRLVDGVYQVVQE